jgi:hypothetical protein
MSGLLAILEFRDYVIITGIVLAVSMATRTRVEMDGLRRQLNAVQRRLDALLKHQGVVLPPPPRSGLSPEVERLAMARESKIQAIRLYREQNPGVSLKEAKERIEAFADRQEPE